jgi:hypothetical protein
MQAQTSARVSVELSKTCKGKPRSKPVWVMRYRLPSGKDSRKVLGPAWTKKGRPPHGYLTEGDALVKAEAFAAEHSTMPASTRGTFRSGLDTFLRYCERRRGSAAPRCTSTEGSPSDWLTDPGVRVAPGPIGCSTPSTRTTF